jgi:hypothetical protein
LSVSFEFCRRTALSTYAQTHPNPSVLNIPDLNWARTTNPLAAN